MTKMQVSVKAFSLILLTAFFCAAATCMLPYKDKHINEGENFEVYVFPDRYGEETMSYFLKRGIKVAQILTHGGISDPLDDSNISPSAIKRYMDRVYPDQSASGTLVIDWETKTYKDLRNHSLDDKEFKIAESKFVELVRVVKTLRPNLKVGVYGLPYSGWKNWQREVYNAEGKFDVIFSKVDFISPSLYLPYADEEVGRARNLQYLKDNLNVSLALASKYKKPVIPFFWHRIHPYNDTYGHAIIQKETFADYVDFISKHTFNNHGASGVLLWDDGRKSVRLSNLEGVDGWLKESVHDAGSYDAMMLGMMKAILTKVEIKPTASGGNKAK